MIWVRTSGGGVRFCEIGTKVLERPTLVWISPVSAVKAASISAIFFGVIHF